MWERLKIGDNLKKLEGSVARLLLRYLSSDSDSRKANLDMVFLILGVVYARKTLRLPISRHIL